MIYFMAHDNSYDAIIDTPNEKVLLGTSTLLFHLFFYYSFCFIYHGLFKAKKGFWKSTAVIAVSNQTVDRLLIIVYI